jgi:hypothetical protein
MPLRQSTHEPKPCTNTLTSMLLKPAPAIYGTSKYSRYAPTTLYSFLPDVLWEINDC